MAPSVFGDEESWQPPLLHHVHEVTRQAGKGANTLLLPIVSVL